MNRLEAEKLLSGRCYNSRKLAPHTYLIRGENITVKLHDTNIVTFKQDEIILNSGGWKTITTKDRMNRFSPARISQRNSAWYIGEYLYYDGIRLFPNGKPINPVIETKQTKDEIKKIKKMAKEYADLCLSQTPFNEILYPKGAKINILPYIQSNTVNKDFVVQAINRYANCPVVWNFVSYGEKYRGISGKMFHKAIYRHVKSSFGLSNI